VTIFTAFSILAIMQIIISSGNTVLNVAELMPVGVVLYKRDN
jgi:glycopeptide antibiotics resistance protein